MNKNSKISWTEATWNPCTGCSRISPACHSPCYAESLANRMHKQLYLSRGPVVDTAENRENPFAVRLWPERLTEPERLKAPSLVFVNSMSDLFHEDVPDSFVRQVFEVMLRVNRHTYQVLTKRPTRMVGFYERNRDIFGGGLIPQNIWMGTTVENQDYAWRVDRLRTLPAEVRFLSCEPLLGPVELNLERIQWVICGGVSGPRHQELRMDLDWARSLRDRCLAANVPFFFKQVGGRTPKAGGELLDEREWKEMPALGHPEEVAA